MGQYANTTQNSLTREKFQQDFSFDDRVGTSKRSVFTLVYVKFLVGIVILMSLGIICCLLPSDILLKGLKAISFGLMAVYFSWEMVYFDSTTPGVYPPSPLSSQMIRKTSFYVIDTSYLFSVINGMLFTVMLDKVINTITMVIAISIALTIYRRQSKWQLLFLSLLLVGVAILSVGNLIGWRSKAYLWRRFQP